MDETNQPSKPADSTGLEGTGPADSTDLEGAGPADASGFVNSEVSDTPSESASEVEEVDVTVVALEEDGTPPDDDKDPSS